MLGRRSVTDSPDDPLVVEAFSELPERGLEFREGGEASEPEQLLLEGADEPLDVSVAFGLPNEGWAGGDPDGAELVLEGVADELAEVAVAEQHALRDADVVSALGGRDGLAEALHRLWNCGLEADSAVGGPHPEEFSGEVIDEDEPEDGEDGVALVGHAAGGIDGPHAVGSLSDDAAVVGLRAADGGEPLLGEEAVLSHEPEDLSHRGEDAVLVAQADPDLAVAPHTRGQRRGSRRARPGRLGGASGRRTGCATRACRASVPACRRRPCGNGG